VKSRYVRFYSTQTNSENENENERKGQGYARQKCQKSNVYIQDGVALNAASTRVRFVPVVGD
jgi:hypothetical protein